MKKYFIITGTSRGLGLAFAEKLLDHNHELFLISRNQSKELSQKALMKNCRIHAVKYDLSKPDAIPGLVSNIMEQIDDRHCTGIYLINNAATAEPVKPIDKADQGEIAHAAMLNYVAPVLLTSAFIKLTEKIKCHKMVLNITSGAATNPHHGMGMYCSTKAAVDQFTRCVAIEQETRENPVHLHAISPGFVDTVMLRGLAGKSIDDFASRPVFNDVISSGKPVAPEKVAKMILDLWLNEKLKHGEVSHLSDYS
jgi:benzil reductase ((S)-benzoin forming)